MSAAETKGPFKRTGAQLLASNPASHVWVSASAGTGKTHVLTDRMLRLMLAGCAPDRILALTFTKAAAAEMQNRLTKRLGDWLTLDDTALDAELAALGVGHDAAMRTRARALFALALDVPGGLKVQTLHGFAQGLLAAFPLEAGLPPGFRALDDRDARLLRQRALNEAISQALEASDSRFLSDLGELAVLKGEGGVMLALDRMIAHTEGVLSFHSEDGIAPAVRRFLNVGPDEKPGDYLAQVLAPGVHDDARLESFAGMMENWATKTGLDAAARARAWLMLDTQGRVAAFQNYHSLFLTDKGTVRKHAICNKRPEVADLMADIARDIGHLEDREARLLTAELATMALRAGHRIAGRYRQLKRANVAIDYDDMISHAAVLLGPAGMPGYIGWKLDSRFDHVLVDEAQDTNARQWAIIERLIEDYFDGEDARARSLFVVGDLKQAIYGFQGTDPRLFVEGAVRLSPGADAGGRPLQQVPLDLSFRSGPAVLAFVNAFLDCAGHTALGMPEAPPPHVPYRADAPGEIQLWPAQAPEDPEEGDEEAEGNSEAADRLMADRLAQQIAAWLKPGHPERLWLPARERYARANDILVLVRKRSWLMGGLVGALHQHGVPVAGVDRLLLTEPYAVLDMLALVRFAVQPEDDLNLACVLVSPFIGWTHEEVRAISGARKGSLWAALGQAAADGGAAKEARGLLNQILALADIAGPYSFLDSILSGPIDGRRRLVARLGSEANDAIDELLQQALAYEVQHPPALAGFLAWIESEGSEVKRDAEAPAAQVRLMTIHGAKGLEAPVVVLADAAHKRKANADSYLPVMFDGAEHPVPLFHPGAKAMPVDLKAMQEARDALLAEEDLRLLYVGLTRAADHLYIGGAVGRQAFDNLGGDKDTSWHTRLARVFDTIADAETVHTKIWGEARRLRRGHWVAPTPEVSVVSPGDGAMDVSDVLTGLAPEPVRPIRPLTPSALPDDPAAGPPPADMRARAMRGTLLHKLFERLPDVPPDRRRAVAAAWLAAQGAVEPDALVEEAMTVLEAPGNAALFGPDALAEAPIAGLVGDRAIAGIVDRLLVEPERVLVVDFKTGLSVPASAADVPMPYKRQMAAYAAVLQRAFPGRKVEAALLYTAAAKLILLDPKEYEGLSPLD